MDSYVHPQALVEEGAVIGQGTRVWAFAHVLPGASIGEDCNICDHVFIENEVSVGDRVTIKCGVQLWDGVNIEDDVFVGPNATFTNDKSPRSKEPPDHFLKTIVHKGASIGANATILPGLSIGREAMVGAGAVVTRDVPPRAVVIGNPARIVDYVDAQERNVIETGHEAVIEPSEIKGVELFKVVNATDMRGDLTAIEWGDELPFRPERSFFVYNVPSTSVRGQHAHKECHQFLVCLRGSVSVIVDDGKNREEYHLDSPEIGIYVPPKIWGTQYKYSPDGLLFVLASHCYDPDDYIRNYDDYLRVLGL